jgi:hypothetical protein
MVDAYEIVFVDRNGIFHTFPLSWASTILYDDRCMRDEVVYANPPMSLHASLYHLYAGKCEMFSSGPMTLYTNSSKAYDKYTAPYAFGGKVKLQDRPCSQLRYQEQDRATIRTVEFDFGGKHKTIYGCTYKAGIEEYYARVADNGCYAYICPSHLNRQGKINDLNMGPSCCPKYQKQELRTVATYGDYALVEVF